MVLESFPNFLNVRTTTESRLWLPTDEEEDCVFVFVGDPMIKTDNKSAHKSHHPALDFSLTYPKHPSTPMRKSNAGVKMLGSAKKASETANDAISMMGMLITFAEVGWSENGGHY